MANEEKSFQKTSINWYPGHMAKTRRLIKEKLHLIDIVYEVIDARMPYSSKIIDLDDIVKNKPKILIMTKYDLCDKKETDKWAEYYKNLGYKVICANLMSDSIKKDVIHATKEIMNQEYDKFEKKGIKKGRTRVLVVGIPNVGKSTLINRLVEKKVTNVGNKPGVTKNLNWIRINEDVELLDSPGILWPKFEEKTSFHLATLGAIKEEVLPIEEVVCYLLKTLYQYYPQILKDRYGVLELNEDFIDVFDTIGKKRGCLVRGGEVDYDKVCTIVMNDVNNGYISGITFDRISDFK